MAEETSWYKSSYSNGGGNCVEVAYLGYDIGVRDSKVKAGPAILLTPSAWSSFIADIRVERH
ncbi:DUF397 domain-containing protein [Streptomyces morookaense]|uniref:DUF397 domain-containing protein n=1 Tax=Streptomyces morookaense TaxID=1970 RepID=A0A7Y7E7R9_STRMO|nr:DUF397 domain-containing protein [Streptomyces morookaense]NVK78557.1 DUF397 domain-containing protein [Streptomyces morookaense]